MDLLTTSSLFIGAIVFLYILFIFGKLSQTQSKDSKKFIAGKYVLVTGCDTGFGREIAVKLDLLGAIVIATCFTENGRADLKRNCSARLKAVLLDVSQSNQIQNLYKEVLEIIPQKKGLWCLVNNAGIISWGPIEWEPLASFKRIADINLWGMIDMTKTFLPLIKRTRGRVLNVSSLNGKVTFANMAPYCITKHGVEAFSDALRREMHPWNVSVSVIEPGGHRTNLLNPEVRLKQSEVLWNNLSDQMKHEYGEKAFRLCQEEFMNPQVSNDITQVVETVVEAIVTATPKPRYVIGVDAKLLIMLSRFLQDALFDKILKILFQRFRTISSFPGPNCLDVNKSN